MHCKSNDPINEFLPLLYFWSKLKMIACQVPINEKEWEVEFLFHEEHWKSIAVQNVNHAFSNQRIFCDHENIVNVFCPQGEKRRNCHRGKHKQKESLSFFFVASFLGDVPIPGKQLFFFYCMFVHSLCRHSELLFWRRRRQFPWPVKLVSKETVFRRLGVLKDDILVAH